MPAAPEKVGKYEILGVIGRGGMGSVYRARDPVLDRVVALKTMSADVLAEEGMRDRFLREARSAARLQHPNIVTVYEFGEVDGAPFIAMEYLDGENLADAAMLGRFRDLSGRLAVVTQLCEGLGYAHRHGVIHRDVKPSNVIIVAGGAAKLVDFGIAWLDDAAAATRTGILLGTPSYMAPEQFAGEAIDHRVDVWAVGVILYELLAGKPPFDGGTVPSLIYQIVHAPLPGINQHVTRLPASLPRVLDRALAKDRAQRYPDLETMAADLRAVRDELPTLAGATGAAPAGGRADEAATLAQTLAAPPAWRAAGAPGPRPGLGLPLSLTPAPRTGVFVEDGVFGEARKVQTVLFSPDDAVLIAGGTDGTIRLWELATRMKVATFRNRVHLRTGHGSLCTCLALSRDGTLLASGHLDGSIYLWEYATGLELDVRLNHEGAVTGLDFTPGDAALVSGGADATLRFWELDAVRCGDARRSLRRQPDPVTCLCLAGGGRTVITGHTGRSLRGHDTATQRLLLTIHGHRSPVSAVAASGDGKLVASAGRDGTVRIHDVDTREPVASHQEHTRAVSSLTFLRGDRRLASVAGDHLLVVWNLDDPDNPETLAGGGDDGFLGLAASRDGRRVIAAAHEGRFHVWLHHQ